MKIKSQAVRDSARGEDCSLRIPGVCNFDPETTILAHVPCGMRGTSIKGPDIIGVYACSACHDLLDDRVRGEAINGWDVIRALAETQVKLVQKGLVTVKGVRHE